jgi:hypothetical protein
MQLFILISMLIVLVAIAGDMYFDLWKNLVKKYQTWL